MNQDKGLDISECHRGYLYAIAVRPHAEPSLQHDLSQLDYTRAWPLPSSDCYFQRPELGCGPQETRLSFLPDELIVEDGLGALSVSFPWFRVSLQDPVFIPSNNLQPREQHFSM